MTAIQEPAPTTEPTTRQPVDPDYQASIGGGFTESFEDFCKRISQDAT